MIACIKRGRISVHNCCIALLLSMIHIALSPKAPCGFISGPGLLRMALYHYVHYPHTSNFSKGFRGEMICLGVSQCVCVCVYESMVKQTPASPRALQYVSKPAMFPSSSNFIYLRLLYLSRPPLLSAL